MEKTILECNSAKEFLNELDLSQERWLESSEWNSQWVFRGQSDANWSLVPSAWREERNSPALKRLETLYRRYKQNYRIEVRNSILQYHIDFPDETKYKVLKCYAQARAEFSIILEFLKLADDLGHPVPKAEEYLKFEDYDFLPNIGHFPNFSFLPVPNTATTLAQHHGIPTRTIDWTYNPVIAAFFAATDLESTKGDGKIAVWAINPKILSRYSTNTIQSQEYVQFKILKSPRADNPYLNAQKGLFLYPTAGCSYYAKYGNWPSLERWAAYIAEVSGQDVIYKITLPHGHVPNLLRLLWARNISKGHLMPTYDNVTQSLATKWELGDY